MGPLVAGSLQVAETTQTGEQCAAVRHLAAETTHPIIHQVQVSTNKARDASDCLPTGSVATGQLAAEPTPSTSSEAEAEAGMQQPRVVLDRSITQDQTLMNKVDELSTDIAEGSPIKHQVHVCTNLARDASVDFPIGRVATGPLVAGSLQVADTTHVILAQLVGSLDGQTTSEDHYGGQGSSKETSIASEATCPHSSRQTSIPNDTTCPHPSRQTTSGNSSSGFVL